MEFSKGIFQFTDTTTELFNFCMEFSGIRENKAVNAGQGVSPLLAFQTKCSQRRCGMI